MVDAPGGDEHATERVALLLFDDLLDVPETSRNRWIDERTADSAVKARLAVLLEADRIASFRTGAAAINLSGPAPLPDRIGQYRITALVGRGGMGAVYRGTRDTGDFQHEVAIKVIKPGLLSDVLAQRFRAERQTLAALQHPNIARLYDGGEMPDGSPFIVMELIEGEPIDLWANAHNLNDNARVQLMETAARAVAHAHQRLIIHRDITPLNVLVQADGALKLIDFGIARPAEAQGAATAVDIAGLGRLLARLVPSPGPELAAIIAHATASPPLYETAEAMADDLAAMRSGNPVQAMQGGERYRVAKFVQRNRRAVAASAFAVFALVAGLAFSLWSLRQADLARLEAEARFAETRSIANSLLYEAFDAVSRVPGATRARETLAATATRYLDGLASIPNAPADVRREAGLGYVRLARVMGGGAAASLGRHEEGNALLKKAATLLEPGRGPLPADPASAEALSTLWLEQAEVNNYNNMQHAEARVQAARAEAITRPHARSSPAFASLHATALQIQGDSWGWDNDYQQALPFFERASGFLDGLPDRMQGSADIMQVRGPILRMRAEAEHRQKLNDRAKASNEASVAANRALVSTDPFNPASQRKLIQSLWYAAVVHRTNYRDKEAVAAIDEALDRAHELVDRDPADLGTAKLLAVVLEVKAQTLADAGKRAETVAATDELLAIHERLVKEGGDTPGALRSMTAALRTRGGDFYNLGDKPAACRMWRRAVENYVTLDKRGELSTYDRENGLPEVSKLIEDVCVKGIRPEGW